MRLFLIGLKSLTLIGAIVTFLGTFLIIPATINYWINPPSELVSLTPIILRIYLFGLTAFASVEAGLFGWLASLEVPLRRARITFSLICVAIALCSLILTAYL
ncbi:MAG: hypothetical protein F6K14_03975 [Symploca sp. SIO2C1]|nr:hypothetical protein [Symploca sp. SIO2C1]